MFPLPFDVLRLFPKGRLCFQDFAQPHKCREGMMEVNAMSEAHPGPQLC